MDRDEARKQQDKEFEAAHKVGAAVEHAHGVPLKGFRSAPALHYPDQATFHPLKYLQAVAQAILDKGGLIFADSPVTEDRGVEAGRARRHRQRRQCHRRPGDLRHQCADQRPGRDPQQDGALPHLRYGLHYPCATACPMRSTGTWRTPITTSGSIPAREPPIT